MHFNVRGTTFRFALQSMAGADTRYRVSVHHHSGFDSPKDISLRDRRLHRPEVCASLALRNKLINLKGGEEDTVSQSFRTS